MYKHLNTVSGITLYHVALFFQGTGCLRYYQKHFKTFISYEKQCFEALPYFLTGFPEALPDFFLTCVYFGFD